jgi:hypothetical protein
VFSEFRAPDLAARLRAAAVWPLGAYLLAQLYFTLYPLLAEVPRWLFESVRVDLLAGLAGGLAAGLSAAHGERDDGGDHEDRQEPRPRLGLPAAGWLMALAGGLLLCGWTLAGMSFPWMV